MEDSQKHQGLRRQLIQDLRSKGIISESVLMVMLKTPRHFFMDQGLINFAYHDQAYPIAADQTISQPLTSFIPSLKSFRFALLNSSCRYFKRSFL